MSSEPIFIDIADEDPIPATETPLPPQNGSNNGTLQQMPPPPQPIRFRQGNNIQQTIQSFTATHAIAGAGAAGQQTVSTTFNVQVCSVPKRSPLWDVAAFSKVDDETSSVQFVGAVSKRTKNNGSVPTGNTRPGPLPITVTTQPKPPITMPMTPPTSPAGISSNRLSVSSDQGSDEAGQTETAKAGQKRPAPRDDAKASPSLGPTKKRITPAPVPPPSTSDKPASKSTNEIAQVGSKSPFQDPKSKSNSKETPAVASTSSSQSKSQTATAATKEMTAEYRAVETELISTIGAYIREKLKVKYDLSKAEDIKRAIPTLKEVNKFMQPGRKRVHNLFGFVETIDRKNYDDEAQAIIRKEAQRKAEKEKDLELGKIVKELEGYDKRLKELDEESIFGILTRQERDEMSLIIESLIERYAVYEKLRGVGNEVFQQLHKEKFRKVILTDVTEYPAINEAVGKFLDRRWKELFKGFDKDGWDNIYPGFEETEKVVALAAREHKLELSKDNIYEMSIKLYESMMHQSRLGRGKDFQKNLDVYVGCSKEKVDELLKSDPANTNSQLADNLAFKRTTAEINMQANAEEYERVFPDGQNEFLEEEAAPYDLSSSAHVDEFNNDLDLETESDSEFIDDSDLYNNNFGLVRAPSPAPSSVSLSQCAADILSNLPPISPLHAFNPNPNASSGVSPITDPTGYHSRTFTNLMDLLTAEVYNDDDMSDDEDAV